LTNRKRQVKARDQHRFGVSQPLSLGVEEELLLVDGDGDLTCAAEDVLESVAGTPIANQVSVEIFTEQIELKTGICHDAGEVFEQLRELRRSVGQAGFGLLGCGLHPDRCGGTRADRKTPLRDCAEGSRQPAEDATLRSARSRRHARSRGRGEAHQRPASLSAGATSPERQLAISRRPRLGPCQRSHSGRAQLPALPGAPGLPRLRGLPRGCRPARWSVAIAARAGELPLPTHFEEAAETLDEEDIAESVICGPDPERHRAAIEEYVDAGYDHIYVHQIGPDQEGFFEFYEREVLPGFS
jgi:Glutamate-cysteine ligase family 2(GCS2)